MRPLSTCLALCALAAAACAQPSVALDDIVEELRAAYPDDEPGLAVMVLFAGEERVRLLRGQAERSAGRPLQCDTPMRIASLTKQFTALAVLQLADEGRLGLDDPVVDHLRDLAPAGEGVSVRDLLNHVSGLPHHSLLFMNLGLVPFDAARNDFLFTPEADAPDVFMPTNADVVALLAANPEPRFAPGSQWEYSNAGYVLLAQVVEVVSGRAFDDYVGSQLLGSIPMPDSGVIGPGSPPPPHRARSYVVDSGGFEERDFSPFNHIRGDGGMYSSLCDLAAWRVAYEPGRVASAAALDLMATPARLRGGERVSQTPRGAGYGMGWFLDRLDDERIMLHGGGWAAFRHAIYFAPEADIWIVVLTNRSDTAPYELGERLMRAALAERAALSP